jgi:hypothetical protein
MKNITPDATRALREMAGAVASIQSDDDNRHRLSFGR